MSRIKRYTRFYRLHSHDLSTHQLSTVNREKVYPCECNRSSTSVQIFFGFRLRLIMTVRLGMSGNSQRRHLGNWCASWTSFLRPRSNDRALWTKNHYPLSIDQTSPATTEFLTFYPAPILYPMQIISTLLSISCFFYFKIRLLLLPFWWETLLATNLSLTQQRNFWFKFRWMISSLLSHFLHSFYE